MPETINLGPLVLAVQGVNHRIGIVAEQIEVVGTRVDEVANNQLSTMQMVLKALWRVSGVCRER